MLGATPGPCLLASPRSACRYVSSPDGKFIALPNIIPNPIPSTSQPIEMKSDPRYEFRSKFHFSVDAVRFLCTAFIIPSCLSAISFSVLLTSSRVSIAPMKQARYEAQERDNHLCSLFVFLFTVMHYEHRGYCFMSIQADVAYLSAFPVDNSI